MASATTRVGYGTGAGRVRIWMQEEVMPVDKEVLIQYCRDERGDKGHKATDSESWTGSWRSAPGIRYGEGDKADDDRKH